MLLPSPGEPRIRLPDRGRAQQPPSVILHSIPGLTANQENQQRLPGN